MDNRGLIRLHFESPAKNRCRPTGVTSTTSPRSIVPLPSSSPQARALFFARRWKISSRRCAALAAAFESEEYQSRRQSVTEGFRDRQSDAFELLQRRAHAEGLALIRTPGGVAVAPVRDGEVISPEEIRSCQRRCKRRSRRVEAIQQELQRILDPDAWLAA